MEPWAYGARRYARDRVDGMSLGQLRDLCIALGLNGYVHTKPRERIVSGIVEHAAETCAYGRFMELCKEVEQ